MNMHQNSNLLERKLYYFYHFYIDKRIRSYEFTYSIKKSKAKR